MIAHGKNFVRSLFVLIQFFGIAGAQAWGDSINPKNNVLGQVESKARRLMHRLKKEGSDVAQGYFNVWPIEECDYTFQRMGLCYGNNPAAPPSQNVNNGDAGIHGFSVENVSAKRPIKTIGIGGVSWTSSVECYRILNELVRDRLGGLSSAQTLMFPIEFGEFSRQERFVDKGDWTLITQTIPGAAQRLKRGGADFIVIASNTLNSFAETVEQEVSLPVLHITDAADEAGCKEGLHSVALLGTKYRRKQHFTDSISRIRHQGCHTRREGAGLHQCGDLR